MSLPVVMKSGKNYLSLVLDPDLPFAELLQAIVGKFRESEKFFGSETLAIMLEGRNLSETEKLQIMDAIDCYTSVHIGALVENDRIREYAADEALRKNLFPEEFELDDVVEEPVCTFIPHTVHTGEQITSDNTIVISGNVEEGAIVSSGEHIIVLGALYGQAICGLSGNEDSHIIALTFSPENFRIGSVIGTKTRQKKSNLFGLKDRRKEGKAKIAFLKDGVIQIKNYTQFI
jgi:septum site-determining protein MinC